MKKLFKLGVCLVALMFIMAFTSHTDLQPVTPIISIKSLPGRNSIPIEPLIL